MVNFDKIEFLESEIVDDDPTAPVGTLVHITEDGKVEPVEQKQDVQAVKSDVQDEPQTEAVEQPVEELSQEPETEDLPEVVEQPVEELSQEPETEDLPEVVEQPVEELSQEPESEDLPEVVEQPVEELSQEPESEDLPEVVEQPVEELSQEPESEDLPEAVEQPVEELSQEPETEDLPEVVEQPVEELSQEPETEDLPEVVEQPVQKARKPRKPAQKKEAAPVVVNDEEHKTSLNLKNGKSVNEELFGTSFEVEQPAKAKIVSTKKKQEKAEDLWAVATVAKPKKETAPVKEETQEEAKPVKKKAKKATKTTETAPKAEIAVKSAPETSNEDVKPAPKKTASKKSTKVENINTSTEEKKVAKTTKEVAAEEKPVKANKTAKEAPVKESPAKEEKVQKAETKTAKDDETVIVEGEGKTHGKYVIKKTDKGNFVFKLYSSNYRVVAIGAQAYTTLGAAKIGIQSIINNAEKAPVENQTLKNYETLKFPKWEIFQDKKGEYRLRLFATNGSLIATTNDGYADITGAKNGIAAVARASKGCAIVRNDNLW